MQHGINERRILRRRFFRATASALGAALLFPRRGLAAESKRAFFDGLDDAGREVMDQARRDIERIRKGDFKLRVVDGDGKPVAAPIELQHVRHEFRFGGPFSENPLFNDLFNSGRMNPHWGVIQKAEDGPDGAYQWEHFDKMLNAAHARDVSMRWHCLIYEEHGTPRWIDAKYNGQPWWKDVPETEGQWWKLIERHLREVGTHKRPGDGKPLGEFLEFDVINETGSRMWTNLRLEAAGKPAAFPSAHNRHPRGWANAARMITLARQYMPKSRLVALEPWPVGDLNNGMTKRVLGHFAKLFDRQSDDPLIRQVAEDPQVLLGCQGHTGVHDRAALTMARINECFERFSQFGKEIAITEYDPPCVPKDKPPEEFERTRLMPEEQAAWSVNFYTLAFSKPYIGELMRWCWADGQSMKRDAGIVFQDFRPKPEYFALKQLLTETWTTRWEGPLAADGSASFRGFFGTYEVSVPGYEPARLRWNSDSPRDVRVELTRQSVKG
jgi:GH35 family endo-1,4-beta-xylanase